MSGDFRVTDDTNRLLTEILQELRAGGVGAASTGAASTGSGASAGPSGRQQPRDMLIIESSNMDHADPDGAITGDPGEVVELVSHQQPNGADVIAVGANDVSGVRYSLWVNDERQFRTNSPLGLLNSPFSFPDLMGTPYPGGRVVSYRAEVSPDVDGPVKLASRMFLERR